MSNTAKETTQPEEHFWETISWADVNCESSDIKLGSTKLQKKIKEKKLGKSTLLTTNSFAATLQFLGRSRMT